MGVGLGINGLFESQIIYAPSISGAAKVNRMLTIHEPTEIPILGSSRAECSYQPSILGPSYYNYGIPGSDANVWLFFLEKELEKERQTPILINFDIKGFTRSIGDEGNYIPNFPATLPVLKEKANPWYYVPFVKYFGWYESYVKYYLNEKSAFTKYIDRGASNEKNVLTPEQFDRLVAKRKQTRAKFTYEKELVNKFHTLLSGTERQIYLVIAPYHSSYFELFLNPEELQDYLNKLFRFENVKVFDLRYTAIDEEEFFNTTHLNYKGAVRFSQEVKQLIAASEGKNLIR